MCLQRCCLLCAIAVAVKAHVILEQPGTSLMYRHPRWIQLCRSITVMWRVRFDMAQYGHGSRKPTLLFSTKKAMIERLAQPPSVPVERTEALKTTH